MIHAGFYSETGIDSSSSYALVHIYEKFSRSATTYHGEAMRGTPQIWPCVIRSSNSPSCPGAKSSVSARERSMVMPSGFS